jgi:hypothetical protein
MRYEVRVTRPGVNGVASKSEDFEDKYADTEEKVQKLSDDANKAYVSAIQKYDPTHTVTIFRDNVSLHNSLGVGGDAIDDNTVEEDNSAPADRDAALAVNKTTDTGKHGKK